MGPLAGYALPPRARRTRAPYGCRAHAICALGFHIVTNSAHLGRCQSPAAENTKPRISERASSAHAPLAVLCVDALVGAWRSLVARLLWEQDVAGSNPVSPTRKPCFRLAPKIFYMNESLQCLRRRCEEASCHMTCMTVMDILKKDMIKRRWLMYRFASIYLMGHPGSVFFAKTPRVTDTAIISWLQNLMDIPY